MTVDSLKTHTRASVLSQRSLVLVMKRPSVVAARCRAVWEYVNSVAHIIPKVNKLDGCFSGQPQVNNLRDQWIGAFVHVKVGLRRCRISRDNVNVNRAIRFR